MVNPRVILNELRRQTPYTFLATAAGMVVVILIVLATGGRTSRVLVSYYFGMHVAHVFFAAIATTSMYCYFSEMNHQKNNSWSILAVGYLGSVGIATMTDALIPYVAERMMSLPYATPHLGLIEIWWLVHPAALTGIAIGYLWPQAKVSHVLHVVISTVATLLHMKMAMEPGVLTLGIYIGVFADIFFAVWLPDTLCDVVIPLLFVKSNEVKHRVKKQIRKIREARGRTEPKVVKVEKELLTVVTSAM